jgi:hypothetical protein
MEAEVFDAVDGGLDRTPLWITGTAVANQFAMSFIFFYS